MSEKENSATKRVFKSIVQPMLKTSVVVVFAASTFACDRAEIEKVGKVGPTPKPIESVGQVPVSTPVVAPTSTPASQGSAVTTPASNSTSKPDIDVVGKVAPTPDPKPPIPKVGDPVPAPIHKVGTVPKPGKPPIKVGKVAPTPDPDHIEMPGTIPPNFGKTPKVGSVSPDNDSPFNRSKERPTRIQRRATDESSSVLRTGFVGGRKLT